MAEFFDILGKAAMRLATPAVQLVGDTVWVVVDCDTIVVQRGGMTASTATNEITVPKTGLYAISFGIDAEFAANDQLDVVGFIDGVQYSLEPAAMQGNGAGKPESMFWQSTVTLNAGEAIDIRMRNGDVGNVDPLVRRVSFSITEDS